MTPHMKLDEKAREVAVTTAWNLSIGTRREDTERKVDQILAAYLAAAHAPQGGVRVKPLVWGPDHVGAGLRAGEYRLRPGLWTHGYYWLRGDEEPHTGYPDEDEAKAAAQADYEARILAALTGSDPQ